MICIEDTISVKEIKNKLTAETMWAIILVDSVWATFWSKEAAEKAMKEMISNAKGF